VRHSKALDFQGFFYCPDGKATHPPMAPNTVKIRRKTEKTVVLATI
jgi:hypothetical protein